MIIPGVIIRHHLTLLYKAIALGLFLILIEVSHNSWIIKALVFMISYILIDEWSTNYFALLVLNKIVECTVKSQRLIQRGYHILTKPQYLERNVFSAERNNRNRPSQGPASRCAPRGQRPATRHTRNCAQGPQPTHSHRVRVSTSHARNNSVSGHDNPVNTVKHSSGRQYHFCGCVGCVMFKETHCARNKCSFCTISYNIE